MDRLYEMPKRTVMTTADWELLKEGLLSGLDLWVSHMETLQRGTEEYAVAGSYVAALSNCLDHMTVLEKKDRTRAYQLWRQKEEIALELSSK